MRRRERSSLQNSKTSAANSTGRLLITRNCTGSTDWPWLPAATVREPREARRALLKRGIAAAFFGPQTAMSYFYSKYRYFAEDSRGWALLARSPETGYLLFALPDPGGAERP